MNVDGKCLKIGEVFYFIRFMSYRKVDVYNMRSKKHQKIAAIVIVVVVLAMVVTSIVPAILM